MGAAFVTGRANHLNELDRQNADNDTSCGFLPNFQEIKAVLIDKEDDIWKKTKGQHISFDPPAEGQMLCISVGNTSLYIDNVGKTLLVEQADIENIEHDLENTNDR